MTKDLELKVLLLQIGALIEFIFCHCATIPQVCESFIAEFFVIFLYGRLLELFVLIALEAFQYGTMDCTCSEMLF